MPDMNPQPEAEGEDIRSMLEQGFKEHEAAPESSSEASSSGEVADAPAAEESPTAAAGATIKDDHPTDPKRYADGTFKQTKAEAAAAKAAPAAEIPSTDAAKASTEQPPTAAPAPPAGWTAAEKAEWSKLSPVAQAAVSRREAEIANGGRQWSEQKQRYETALAPIAQAANRRGISTQDGITQLMAAQDFLDRDAPSAIKWLAQNYGVDLATLAGQPPAEGSREPQAPDISRLVQQAVAPFLAPIQERMRQEQFDKEQSTVNLVTDFASQSGHEHFEAVQSELMALIPAVKNANPHWTIDKVLQDAYDRAVYANPTTRQALSAAQQQAVEAKRVADAKARTTQARSAAVSLTGSPVGTNGAEVGGTIRDELMRAMNGG